MQDIRIVDEEHRGVILSQDNKVTYLLHLFLAPWTIYHCVYRVLTNQPGSLVHGIACE